MWLARKKCKYYSPKRRRIMAQGDPIKSLDVFERDNWICHLCDNRINRYLRLPNWWAATIDHVIPISEGGTHTWDNVKAAHAKCNWDKANKTPVAV